ncbi:MAG: hypothetical protein AB1333_04240 [Patescibacteria group bacterium]
MKRPFKIFFGIFAALAVVGGVLKSFGKDFDKDINWEKGDAATS